MGTQVSIRSANLISMPLPVRQWFAVHTSSRHEKQVALQFNARGIEHLLPLYEEAHRWGDRRVKVQLPLFPGYLFVHVMPTQRLDVLSVPGVAHMVGVRSGPTPVDDCEIDMIRRGIASGIRVEPHPYLKAGCPVRVRNGALCGLEGILVRTRNSDRIVVSVDLIMKSVALEVDAADLEVIS